MEVHHVKWHPMLAEKASDFAFYKCKKLSYHYSAKVYRQIYLKLYKGTLNNGRKLILAW